DLLQQIRTLGSVSTRTTVVLSTPYENRPPATPPPPPPPHPRPVRTRTRAPSAPAPAPRPHPHPVRPAEVSAYRRLCLRHLVLEHTPPAPSLTSASVATSHIP